VQQLSVDEAFIDVSGMERFYEADILASKKTGEDFSFAVIAAQKVKEAVKQRTGLTVSTGIATNKYIAKIASGIKKPDGLYFIPPGGEEDFMRALPVSKIWGAGGKSQEAFRRHGFKKCADIIPLPLDTLKLLFGDAFGIFLYRAVRGQAANAFDEERGSHSMSAERTFPYDLFDEFAIETALFKICETLMARLLNEEWQCKTVQVKIRYAGFITESARETGNAIATFNELYTRIVALFRKKYKSGLGVRLIGAGLMNIETKHTLVQNDLFDMRSDKERLLEKTVLRLNNKYPHAVRRGRGITPHQDD
jgi:DNA polymerase-4